MRAVGAALVTLAALACLAAPVRAQRAVRRGQLFPPENLGVLESPDRDEWQQPERIMDELRIAAGSHVADVGAGGGWFTVRLARRVWPNGVVFAEDIQREMIDTIGRRVRDQGLSNVRTVLGGADDPRLPSNLDAILMVDTYTQVASPVRLLGQLGASLAPNGLIGVVDFRRDGAGGPGPALDERVDPERVVRAATDAGLALRARHDFLRYQYFLVFGRTPATSARVR
jgi:ubiquinone/menaquinone biosynthesis C-methylase UbiE